MRSIEIVENQLRSSNDELKTNGTYANEEF